MERAPEAVKLIENVERRMLALASLRGGRQEGIDDQPQRPLMHGQILRRQHEIDRRVPIIQIERREIRPAQHLAHAAAIEKFRMPRARSP